MEAWELGAGLLLAAARAVLVRPGDRARCHLALPRRFLSHGSPTKADPEFSRLNREDV